MDRPMLVEAFSHEPPSALFHYTTQSGLLGILKSKEIWATHNQYLNDSLEYLHAIELARYRIAQLKYPADKSEVEAWRFEALTAMSRGLTGVEGECVCVFSLSEDADSLSQWRAYGGHNSGFAIGFSRETLHSICERRPVQLGKCIYNPEDQRRLIEQLVDTVLEEAFKLRQPGITDWSDKVSAIMGNYMNRYAPLLKHVSFGDEQEWRLISGAIAPFAVDFDFREGRSTIVPYLKLCLQDEKGPKFCPTEVVIGPTPRPVEAAHAVSLLLVRKGMDECAFKNVRASKVPYRSW